MTKQDLEFVAQQLCKPSGDFAETIGQKMDEVNEPLFDLTLAAMDPESGDQILEVGFGTGKYIERLFRGSENLQVTGIDYSSEMVEMARKNNQNAITDGQLEVQLGQSDDLPFPEASFDKVFCNMVVYFWDDPAPHLQEVKRVLKPGGLFFTGIRARESMLNFPFVDHGFRLYSLDKWKEILGENGFSFVRTTSALDPAIEVDGSETQLRSYCVVAAN
ncbi:class I SAM-dependent methyltransferase [Fodinibius sp. SL11]|uniref:class I SAM-dependent methyltransferase n=1 Tax=Fodinibius sp. SL11 TaxID=3425690 RepID=UPI003F8846E2